jgi:hypothetical protein
MLHHGNLPIYFTEPTGLRTTPKSDRPAFVFGIDGKRIAATHGNSSLVPGKRLAPGAYVEHSAGSENIK